MKREIYLVLFYDPPSLFSIYIVGIVIPTLSMHGTGTTEGTVKDISAENFPPTVLL